MSHAERADSGSRVGLCRRAARYATNRMMRTTSSYRHQNMATLVTVAANRVYHRWLRQRAPVHSAAVTRYAGRHAGECSMPPLRAIGDEPRERHAVLQAQPSHTASVLFASFTATPAISSTGKYCSGAITSLSLQEATRRIIYFFNLYLSQASRALFHDIYNKKMRRSYHHVRRDVLQNNQRPAAAHTRSPSRPENILLRSPGRHYAVRSTPPAVGIYVMNAVTRHTSACRGLPEDVGVRSVTVMKTRGCRRRFSGMPLTELNSCHKEADRPRSVTPQRQETGAFTSAVLRQQDAIARRQYITMMAPRRAIIGTEMPLRRVATVRRREIESYRQRQAMKMSERFGAWLARELLPKRAAQDEMHLIYNIIEIRRHFASDIDRFTPPRHFSAPAALPSLYYA